MAATRSPTSCSIARCSGWSAITPTVSGSTPSPPRSTSTTRAKPGEWIPQSVRRAREPRRGRLFPPHERGRPRHVSRRDRRGRGIDRVADGLAPDVPRRARLRVQVEHGVDARRPRLHDPRSRAPEAPPQPADLRPPVRVDGELRPAPLTRRVVHGKGSLLARMPATTGNSSPTFARSTRSCGRTRARSSSSWAARSGSAASGITTGASTGICSTRAPTTAVSSGWCVISIASTGRARAPRAGRRPRRVRVDRLRRTGNRAWCRSCDAPETPATSCSSCAISRRWRATPTGSGSRGRAITES